MDSQRTGTPGGTKLKNFPKITGKKTSALNHIIPRVNIDSKVKESKSRGLVLKLIPFNFMKCDYLR